LVVPPATEKVVPPLSGVELPLTSGAVVINKESDKALMIDTAKAIEIKTEFRNFDDYWQPFLENVGAAPSYLKQLGTKEKLKLEDLLRKTLPTNQNGSISLSARAWAVKGIVLK
jgi:hypothetical protein